MGESFVKRINDDIENAMDVGVRNLELAGYHALHRHSSIAGSVFSITIEGNDIVEFEDMDDAIDVATRVEDDHYIILIDGNLSDIDKFIQFTVNLASVKVINQCNASFMSAAQNAAHKSGISLAIYKLDNYFNINIRIPCNYSIREKAKKDLQSIAVHKVRTVHRVDHTLYDFCISNDEYSKLRLIEWATRLPNAETECSNRDLFVPFRDKAMEILRSKKYQIMDASEEGDSGLYRIKYACAGDNVMHTYDLGYNPLYRIDVMHMPDESDCVLISFGCKYMNESINAILKLLDSIPMNESSKKLSSYDIM